MKIHATRCSSASRSRMATPTATAFHVPALALFLAISSFTSLCGCSVYESPGRKYLEQNGLQIAKTSGVSQENVSQNVVSCGQAPLPTDPRVTWIMIERNSLTTVYAYEGEPYDLLIKTNADENFSCSFRFASAQEMYEKTSAATDFTVLMFQLSPPQAPSGLKARGNG